MPISRRSSCRAWLEFTRNWDKLDTNDQVWLLEWGRRDFQDSIGPVLEAALSSSCAPVLQTAVGTLSHGAISELYPLLLQLAAEALTNDDPQIRSAAVAANPPGVAWRRMLATEKNASVRRACLTALRTCEAEKALPDLVESLRDQDWRTRAVAAKELVALALQRFMRSERWCITRRTMFESLPFAFWPISRTSTGSSGNSGPPEEVASVALFLTLTTRRSVLAGRYLLMAEMPRRENQSAGV